MVTRRCGVSGVFLLDGGHGGACAELFARVLSVHEHAIDDYLEGEVARVLRDTFKLPADRLAGVTALLGSTAIRLTAPPLDEPACCDPDDDRVLMLALAFRAEVLVTGRRAVDGHHPRSPAGR